MIPTYDSFDFFSSLFPLLILLVPVAAFVRIGAVRRAVFVLSGLGMLYLIAPRLALFHLVFWVMVAALQPLVSRMAEQRFGSAVFWASMSLVLAPMIAWKLWPVEFQIEFTVRTNGVFRATSEFLEAADFTAPLVAPIGLSFAAFRAADLLIRSNLGLVDRLLPDRVLAFGLFVPLQVVGPIASYDETASTIEQPIALTRERALLGVTQILTGLFKVFVLAYLLSWSTEILEIFRDNPPWRIWISLLAYTFFFYVNFSGYADMAIGCGHLLGGDIRPNFDAPFSRTNPAAFWNNWHMSLTRFLRINVFTPVVGRHPKRMYFGLALTMMLVALWHSITWASVLFGLYHGAALILHRFVERRRPPSEAPIWRFVKPCFVVTWFGLGLPLLALDAGDAIDLYRALVGAA